MPIPRLKKLISLLLLFSVVVCPGAWGEVDFDGVDDYVDTNNKTLGASLGSFSLSIWVKSSDTDLDSLINSVGDGSTERLQVQMNSSATETLATGNMRVQVIDNDGKILAAGVNSNTGISNGSWHHLGISVKCSTNTVLFYVDGVKKTTTTALSQTPANFSNFQYDLVLAARNLRGVIDDFWTCSATDFAAWNVVLSDAEFSLLYSSKLKMIPLQIKPSNLIFYFPLSNGPSGTSADGGAIQDIAFGNNGVGVDGANNTGCTWAGETVLSYSSDE